ncbi:DeoR/GlpR family DNA-binding transcription regulator [Thalassoglobus sp. JC818]|uniref:DeoR/GlpR family DNA-binding transcription regulator n=1 Tax=Thalassoglobus sp. JC818 TaxID=3232136 RepID=UPI0034589F32
MLLDQRRIGILEIIERKGFASLCELANEVDASQSTIRRDLEHLERSGQVRRTRGGAAYVGESLTGFEERRHLAADEKHAIAKAVVRLISPQETIILDGGTTTLEVAKLLSGLGLQVVTNSLPVVNHLVGSSDTEVVFLGGYLYPKTGVALGELTIESLKRVHARRLIMSVGGITEEGLFNTNSLLAETERQMMESADEIIVVTDSSKLGHSELVCLGPLSKVDRIVVDEKISNEWRQKIVDQGIELTIA